MRGAGLSSSVPFGNGRPFEPTKASHPTGFRREGTKPQGPKRDIMSSENPQSCPFDHSGTPSIK